jgi:hypothetical protein
MAALLKDVDAQRIVVSNCLALTTVHSAADLPVQVARNINGIRDSEAPPAACLYAMTPPMAVDNRLVLAYEAAQKTLEMQDTTLGNLRTRANNLLATAALFTTFAAGVGLIKTDPTKGQALAAWKALVLLGLLAVLGLCVLRVLWTVDDWAFGPSSVLIFQKINESPSPSEDEIRKYVITEMNIWAGKNHTHLVAKQAAFKCAAVLLIIQVAVLVVLLVWWR